MPQEPTGELSGELAALIRRAEGALATARQLMNENEYWRRSVAQQLDYMYELGAEFRRPALKRPATLGRPRGEDEGPAPRSGSDDVPTPSASA